MTTPTLAQQISTFAVNTRIEDFSPSMVENLKARVLDVLGICAAATQLESSRAASAWAANQGGRGEATAVGVPNKISASQAAFVNGVLAHSLDYDDTHLPSVLHPSATIVPAVMAAAEKRGATGAEALTAIAIGIEVCVRLGMAGFNTETKNSEFFEHGQHATSICGAMGAAAAIASFDADPLKVTNALGLVASSASGIIEANRTGGTVKRLHCGWAAKTAIEAVELVEAGFTGPPTVLEGRFGFYQAWLHGYMRDEEITRGLGTNWSIEEIFFKPYPANHFTHAAVDAAAALRRSGITPDDIESLELGVPAPTLRTIGEPIQEKRSPKTGYQAQFSGPYAVAAGLIGGSGLEVGLDDYTDALATEPLRQAIMHKVTVLPDDECTAIFPHQFPAKLRAFLRNGEVVQEKVLTTRGGKGRPLSFDELSEKFADNALRTLPLAQTERITAHCRSFDDIENISSMLKPLMTIYNS